MDMKNLISNYFGMFLCYTNIKMENKFATLAEIHLN